MDQSSLSDRHPGGNVKSEVREKHVHISVLERYLPGRVVAGLEGDIRQPHLLWRGMAGRSRGLPG